jgi:tetratricopeptide (TPR) repeat protein
MAIIKCKMCGGDIEISADKTFGTCEYCGSTMTLPKVDDEQRAAAFNRGNHFRRSGEFDKALAVYERIVAEDDNDAEAHWCCALCRFGIEYVEDPATYEWLPTCHRASFDSFLEDVDYLAAVEHSDGITRRQYQKDAAKIAEVQRGILATSQNEQPFDVFLCYKETGEDGQRTRDSLMAQEVYYELTEQGYRVFFARITLEDKAGTEYEPYIFAALNSAKVMVVIGTKPEHFNAVWVKNEWSRFLSMMKKDRSKLLLPCYRDMDPYDLPEALSVLQSYDMSKIGFMQDLIRGVKKVIDAGKPQETAKETVKETVVVHNEGGSNVQALLDRGQMALEDGEWTKADEFFEQVLNQDAKCGAAYLGKFLARVKCRSAKAYADAFIGNVKANVPSKKNAYACEEDKAFSASCMEKYTVPGILSENEIRQALKFDSGFCVTSDYYAKAAENARAQLTADKDLMRAVKYASGEAKTIAENLPQTLDTLRRDAEQREKVERAAITANYRDFLTKTEAELEKEHPQRLKEAEDARKAEIFRRRKVKATAKKAGILAAIVAGIVTAAVLFTVNVILPPVNYSKAEKLLAAGDVKKAAISFGKCAGYQDARERSMSLWDTIADRKTLVANGTSIIALKIDGTAIGSSDINGDEADVSNWTDIVALSTGLAHTVGLKSNGTVVAVGQNLEGECDISDWTDIVAISAGTWSTFGLKANGTVVAIGSNEYDECDVSDWTDIVAINARTFRTVGLKADGTVVAVGWSNDGQCDVSDWTDIVAISTGDFHTVGLRANGTVVAVGDNEDGQCDVSDWTDIVAISAGYRHTVGLKADGTVVAVGNNDYDQCDVSDWTDIVAIDAGYFHTVGLKADGTVVAVDDNESGQCDVSGWKDIKLPN